MKIALIGYGKMGQMIEKVACDCGHSIIARLSSCDLWDQKHLLKADLFMDFTSPKDLLERVNRVAELKKPLIIGTTGWDRELTACQAIVKKNQIGVLYSPNFSIGVHLLFSILSLSSQLIHHHQEYDAAHMESHHRQKQDAPSGTALEIAKILKAHLTHLDQIPSSSLRCGSIPGTHTVLFDSPWDTISISHVARSREGFARGAIQAGEWLVGKTGFFTFSDFLKEKAW